MLGAAELVLSTALSMPVVVFLAVDFWLICPGIRRSACRLAPQSRGTRVILIRDEIFTKERRLCPGGLADLGHRGIRPPAGRGVPARAQDHGPERPDARRGVRGGGARGRRAGGHPPGRQRPPTPAPAPAPPA